MAGEEQFGTGVYGGPLRGRKDTVGLHQWYPAHDSEKTVYEQYVQAYTGLYFDIKGIIPT
jgi:hypothetical protein